MVKDDLAYIEHILDCIRKIKEFTTGLSLKDFSVNELVQDAVIRILKLLEKHQRRYLLIPNRYTMKSPGKRLPE